jgi:hypothetical protein
MTREGAGLAFDREGFQRDFDRQPFRVEHDLCGHPLFELERLVELSCALPTARVEYNAGTLPVTQDPRQTPRTGLSVAETIRRIEQCRSWMVLKNVESDAEYRALGQRCLEPMRELCPDMRAPELFVFVSSPDAITPYHIDPECNFLLQIRGTKTMRTFPAGDRSVLSEEALERFYAGGSRNLLELTPQTESKARVFELAPGQGVHVPVNAPHWVQNGPQVSISFSVTFRTDASDRREIAYRINHRMRQLRLRPRPVGRSPVVDDVKYALFDAARSVVRALKLPRSGGSVRYEP